MPGPMQTWEVQHPVTHQPVQVQFDHEPTDAELDQYFAQQQPAGGVPPAPQGTASKPLFTNTNKWGITRDLTPMEKVRQNLPLIAGTAAGVGTAIAGTPLLPAAGLAGAAAFAGEGIKNAWRAYDNLPAPPTHPGGWGYTQDVGNNLLDQGESGVMNGVLPELTGRAIGYPIGKAGDMFSRIGSEGRNARAIETAVNPKGLKVSRTGGEVGQQVQASVKVNQENAQQPLSDEYDKLLQGPFGKAREFVDYTNPNTGEIENAPVGDQIAQMHRDRSAALKPGITAKDSTAAMAARTRGQAVGSANTTLNRIVDTAQQHDISSDEYVNLSNQWRAVQEQFANPMQRQLQGKAGGNVIDTLANPAKWKSFTPKGGAAPLDQGQLLPRFFSTLDPGMRSKVQVAVGKRIVSNATDNGVLDPTRLLASLDQVDKYGVGEHLLNGSKNLRDYATALQKFKNAPEVPGVLYKASFINKMLEKGLGDPDVQRMAWRMKGQKGAGQKLFEVMGQFGAQAPQFEDTTDEPIPQPPVR